MTIVEKIKMKQTDIYSRPPLTVAFLGDSVTHGCFELYPTGKTSIDVVYDPEYAYHNRLKQMLNILYPSVPFNVINAGISGDSAPKGLERLERDVLQYHPDLTVVCFGLNDGCRGIENVPTYLNALREIFARLKAHKSAVIFMTPNTLGTKINDRIQSDPIKNVAATICTEEHRISLDRHMETARKLCAEMSVPLCDCYALWKEMAEAGVDTTSLLSNDINHPIRELHYMFAYELLKLILGGQV